jgi:hypothetical protein
VRSANWGWRRGDRVRGLVVLGKVGGPGLLLRAPENDHRASIFEPNHRISGQLPPCHSYTQRKLFPNTINYGRLLHIMDLPMAPRLELIVFTMRS